MPKVSVILPVYNVEPYLDETLISLRNQTLKDIEILAVNDGSSDNSENILKIHAAEDKRIKCYNQENMGQSSARNTAMQYAIGEYIYFMDSDDTIEEKTLEECYLYAKKTQADFIFFDGETIIEQGASPIPWNYNRTYLVEENHSYSGSYLLNLMLDKQKHNCVVWLLFISHSFLKKTNIIFYPGIIHEDELYTALLTLQSNNIFALKRSFAKHRIRPKSTMGTLYSKRNINCYLTVIDELLKFQFSTLTEKYASYTLSKVFYTGHSIPRNEKWEVFWRAAKSGYLKYIGIKSILVFWFKR